MGKGKKVQTVKCERCGGSNFSWREILGNQCGYCGTTMVFPKVLQTWALAEQRKHAELLQRRSSKLGRVSGSNTRANALSTLVKGRWIPDFPKWCVGTVAQKGCGRLVDFSDVAHKPHIVQKIFAGGLLWRKMVRCPACKLVYDVSPLAGYVPDGDGPYQCERHGGGTFERHNAKPIRIGVLRRKTGQWEYTCPVCGDQCGLTTDWVGD